MSVIEISYANEGYAPSPDKPVILINVPSSELFDYLRSRIEKLSRNEISSLSLENDVRFRLHQIDELELVSDIESEYAYNEPRIINKVRTRARSRSRDLESNTLSEFLWKNDKDGRLDVLGLMEGVVEKSHQYLSDEGRDDCLVILSFLENRPRLIQK